MSKVTGNPSWITTEVNQPEKKPHINAVKDLVGNVVNSKLGSGLLVTVPLKILGNNLLYQQSLFGKAQDVLQKIQFSHGKGENPLVALAKYAWNCPISTLSFVLSIPENIKAGLPEGQLKEAQNSFQSFLGTLPEIFEFRNDTRKLNVYYSYDRMCVVLQNFKIQLVGPQEEYDLTNLKADLSTLCFLNPSGDEAKTVIVDWLNKMKIVIQDNVGIFQK